MKTKLVRCLQLYRALARRGAITTSEAALELGVDREVALRDIDALRQVVPEIAVVGDGRKRRYTMGPPVRVSFGEQVALQFGMQVLEFLGGTHLQEWLDGLRDKFSPGAVPGSKAQADRLAARILYVSEPFRPYAAHDETVDGLFKALGEDREVSFTYADGKEYARFQPFTLIVYRRALYVLGHSVGRTSTLTLAVDRIRELAICEQTFRYPTGFSAAAELKDYFGMVREPAPERVVLRFPARKRGLIEARVWHASQVVQDAPDGRVELVMFAGGRELVNFALEWGAACEVVEPKWLRDEVMRELRGALLQYDGGGG